MNPQTTGAYERARQAEADGRLDLAEALFLQCRRPGDAGRVAYRGGRFADAARHYLDAAMHFEAAACLYRAGDAARCLDALVRVPRDHAAYRRACQMAIRVACERDALDLTLDHFLSRYLAAPPRDEHDLEAFERIAKLYELRAMPESAAEVYARILEAHPAHPDAPRRLARALRAAQPAAVDATIASQDLAFTAPAPRRPTAPQVQLPDLPELPPMPARTVATSPRRDESPSGVVAALPFDVRALAPGAMLAGRYRVERKLGEGGMATVYAAHDAELDETVAVKVFHSEDPQLVARFKQEVALSRKLAHPNVIRLYDLGAHGATRFLTMELLDGRDLDGQLGEGIDLAAGVRILLQACAGLGAAHAAGIVHRDIKPANFFVTRDGVVKLMDFGIARRQSAASRLTAAGFIAGTPQYMAPEQITNFANATASSDLYSLGCMAFEMFAGSMPFEHDDLMSLLMMHVREPAPLLRSRATGAPASLEALVASMLAKDPARRPASCEALAQSLRAVLREL